MSSLFTTMYNVTRPTLVPHSQSYVGLPYILKLKMRQNRKKKKEEVLIITY